MRITLLGCGASTGVPLIGCDCATCCSDNPRNRRSRVSLLAQYSCGTHILVDSSPDLWQQALRHDIRRVDAVIYTHEHADHTHGIDDLRSFNRLRNGRIDAYGNARTIEDLQRRFDYVWQPHHGEYWTRTALNAHIVKPGEVIQPLPQVQIQTFSQHHGAIDSLGLRFGNLVYSTDVNAFPDESLEHLRGMEVWIVDCLREGFAGTHANLENVLAWVEQFRPRLTVLTHMNHEMEYAELCRRLPPHIVPGYDGMQFIGHPDGQIEVVGAASPE